MTDTEERGPTLAEMQETIRQELVEILTGAQAKVREAQRLLGSIPPAYRQNGLKGSLDIMRKRLDETDELFIGAYKSVQDTYSPPRKTTEDEPGDVA